MTLGYVSSVHPILQIQHVATLLLSVGTHRPTSVESDRFLAKYNCQMLQSRYSIGGR